MLDVAPRSAPKAIRNAYKRVALLTRPDKSRCPGTDRAYKLVLKAGDVLLNERKRRRYDAARSVAAAMAAS